MPSKDPFIQAIYVSYLYFDLNEVDFIQALTDDVVFSVEAQIINDSEKSENSFKATLEGKEVVSSFLSERHFSITDVVILDRLNLSPLAEDQIGVDFSSRETKMEPGGPIHYKYTGVYELTFSQELKVKKIVLKNRRSQLDAL